MSPGRIDNPNITEHLYAACWIMSIYIISRSYSWREPKTLVGFVMGRNVRKQDNKSAEAVLWDGM